MDTEYTNGEREFLLKTARLSIEKYLTRGDKLDVTTANQKLWEKRGVFVTLTRMGKLRGCVGYIEPTESLIVAVRDNAIAAANDSRFINLQVNELPSITIEISILSQPEKVEYSEIESGDGIIIKKGERGATFLPQVWQQLPEMEKFFSSLCLKAGMEENEYKLPGMDFYKYKALIFNS